MQLIAASSQVPGARCLSARRVAATRHVAERLGVEAGTRVVRLERVRTADGEPVIVSIDYVAEPIMADRPRRASLQRSMYDLLDTLGHPIHHGEAALAPAASDAWTSPGPGLQTRPVQQVEPVDFDAEAMVHVQLRTWHLPRAVDLRVFRRGPGTRSASSRRGPNANGR